MKECLNNEFESVPRSIRFRCEWSSGSSADQAVASPLKGRLPSRSQSEMAIRRACEGSTSCSSSRDLNSTIRPARGAMSRTRSALSPLSALSIASALSLLRPAVGTRLSLGVRVAVVL